MESAGPGPATPCCRGESTLGVSFACTRRDVGHQGDSQTSTISTNDLLRALVV